MSRYIKSSMADLNSEDVDIRVELAYDTDTDISILEVLSEDPYPNVRGAVATNPNTPASILEKLSKDENWGVRADVARNPKTSMHILQELGMDEVYDVRKLSRVEYEVELSFAGIIGATETLYVSARVGIDEEELHDIILNQYDTDLMDLLDPIETNYLGDGDWEITLNFNGYIGCDNLYSVLYADDEDSAVSEALNEAIFDFAIEDFKCLGR